MSRRNAATRRRAYGRRLHEVRERREPREHVRFDWLDEPEAAADAQPAVDHAAFDDWHSPRRGGGTARP